MRKIYQQSLWIYFIAYLGVVVISASGAVMTLALYQQEKYVGFFICGALIIFVARKFFFWFKNFAIIIDNESITSYKNIKNQNEFIRIKWDDIIAIYTMKISDTWEFSQIFLVIPCANVDEKYNEVINFEVKTNREGKKAKAYYDWLITHHKGIKIFKWIKDYRNILKEICTKNPYVVIDNEIKELIRR
ncbi:MAG: hypothetical protein AB1630_12510 [bacterium]